MAQRKQDVITFKVDKSLTDALRRIPNRSQFIRSAVQAALDGACPFCAGTGLLSPEQRKHWEAFAVSHVVKECSECHGLQIHCPAQAGRGVSSG